MNWRKIGSVALHTGEHIVQLGSAIGEPHLRVLETFIEGVQSSIPDAPGADKKAIVVAASDAAILSQLANLTPEQQQQVRAARDAYIDAYVALRKAQTLLMQAIESFKAA